MTSESTERPKRRRRALRIAALALLVVVIAVWISVRKAVDSVTTNVSVRLSDLQIPPVDREAVKLDGDLMTLVTKVSLASAAKMAIPCDEKANEISKAANASAPRCPETPTDAVFQRHDRADHTSLTLQGLELGTACGLAIMPSLITLPEADHPCVADGSLVSPTETVMLATGTDAKDRRWQTTVEGSQIVSWTKASFQVSLASPERAATTIFAKRAAQAIPWIRGHLAEKVVFRVGRALCTAEQGDNIELAAGPGPGSGLGLENVRFDHQGSISLSVAPGSKMTIIREGGETTNACHWALGEGGAFYDFVLLAMAIAAVGVAFR